jgi:hypothetical protein
MSELFPSTELEELLDTPFTFQARPKPVPGSLRPAWRIPAILLLIRKCRGEKASLEQLHVLNWAVRDRHAQETFLGFLSGEIDPDDAIVSYEPALNRALDLALGQGLLTWTDAKRLTLSEEGKATLAVIDESEDLLWGEKAFLSQIKTPVSQAMVQRLLRRESA